MDYYRKITSPKYIESYAFFPLIHRILSDRKYKKIDVTKYKSAEGKPRSHRHRLLDGSGTDKTVKNRPLHYSSHFDSLIYSYYAKVLGDKYEIRLKEDDELNKAVLAYRKIPISDTDSAGKSNIHFAKEVFSEINSRVESQGEVSVLAIDLKSFFFTLDHNYLYKVWTNVLGEEELPKDHLNVFKSCTNFSYVLYNWVFRRDGASDFGQTVPLKRSYNYIKKLLLFPFHYSFSERFSFQVNTMR